MAGEKKPQDQPYHVRLVGNADPSGFVHGLETEDMAKADAASRNERADALGIKARYEVVAV